MLRQMKEPVGSRRHYRISEDGPPPVRGEVDLVRTQRGIFVSGRLETSTEAVCSRCLADFEQVLELSLEEEYLSKFEEGSFAINEGEIDLGEAVRQYTLLATPMKPLCRANCAGLCVYCGRDLNTGSCTCLNGGGDSRFSVLTSLKESES